MVMADLADLVIISQSSTSCFFRVKGIATFTGASSLLTTTYVLVSIHNNNVLVSIY